MAVSYRPFELSELGCDGLYRLQNSFRRISKPAEYRIDYAYMFNRMHAIVVNERAF